MPLNDLFDYKILSSEEGSIKALIDINPGHRIYEGHFPGKPVTPGVALVEIFRLILSEQLDKNLMLSEAKDIKYLSSVVPPDTNNLTMAIIYQIETNKITASCVLSGNNNVYTKVRASFSEIG